VPGIIRLLPAAPSSTGSSRSQSSNLATRSRWRASRPELAAATWPQAAQARAPDKAKARGKPSRPRPRQAGPLYPKEDGGIWLQRKAPLGKGCHSKAGQGAVRGRIELAPGKPRLYTSGPRGLARECAVGLRPEPQHPELCCSAPSAAPRRLAPVGNTRALPAVTTCAARHVPGHKPERGSFFRRCRASARPHRCHGRAGVGASGGHHFSTGQIHQTSLNFIRLRAVNEFRPGPVYWTGTKPKTLTRTPVFLRVEMLCDVNSSGVIHVSFVLKH
jgi:hypothetical protein